MEFSHEQARPLDVLTAVPDPRGLRYPLTGLLAVAVCAVMAGASSVAAIADWLHDLDDIARARLGFVRGVPATTTMWRLLIRLDADLLATILAGWLRTRTQPSDRPRRRGTGRSSRSTARPCGAPAAPTAARSTCCPHWTPAPASSSPRSPSVRSRTKSLICYGWRRP
jgi:hypothetical protein